VFVCALLRSRKHAGVAVRLSCVDGEIKSKDTLSASLTAGASCLVGLEVTIERLEGRTKASQNQPERNRASVLEALAKEQPESEFARFMRSELGQRR
jgi:predicted FMN-binding regulatory protein PaiB